MTTGNTISKLNCKHNFKTVTNLYGRIVKEYVEKGVVYRSLLVCTICGKRTKSTEVNPSCNVKNRPELW